MRNTRCTTCQAVAPDGAAFCPACGAPLSPGSPPAVDPQLAALDRLVAIKVLRTETTDAAGVERFRREARTAARLTHPNIVPLPSFAEAEGHAFLRRPSRAGEAIERAILDGKACDKQTSTRGST